MSLLLLADGPLVVGVATVSAASIVVWAGAAVRRSSDPEPWPRPTAIALLVGSTLGLAVATSVHSIAMVVLASGSLVALGIVIFGTAIRARHVSGR